MRSAKRKLTAFGSLHFSLTLLVLHLVLPDCAARSGDEFARLLAPMVDRPRTGLASIIIHYPGTSVRSATGRYQATRAELTGRIPIAGTQTSLWQAGWQLTSLVLETEAKLPRPPGTSIPARLHDFDIILFSNGKVKFSTAMAGSRLKKLFICTTTSWHWEQVTSPTRGFISILRPAWLSTVPSMRRKAIPAGTTTS